MRNRRCAGIILNLARKIIASASKAADLIHTGTKILDFYPRCIRIFLTTMHFFTTIPCICAILKRRNSTLTPQYHHTQRTVPHVSENLIYAIKWRMIFIEELNWICFLSFHHELSSNFALTLGYLNPASNNPALFFIYAFDSARSSAEELWGRDCSAKGLLCLQKDVLSLAHPIHYFSSVGLLDNVKKFEV